MIRRVDRYELLEEVGSGGMAVVYRGRDVALDREVAVKLLHPHLAARSESRARFSREARAVARLRHPNIVEIYDYAGDEASESFLVTEFVRGRTLREFADQERLDLPEIGALLARTIADALVHAHAAGVIHRDLKPENILVLETAECRAVKLVDFGIARILASDEKMTMTGALVGSPNHMAPEIIEGREADALSDVFSLGTILYWLALGRMPFEASNPTATLRRIIEGSFADPAVSSPLITEALSGAIQHSLVIDPAKRTPGAAAFRAELDAALASVGIEDPVAELDSCLADLPGYRARLRHRLALHALDRAEQALDRGAIAEGMRLLDRVLSLEPENRAVAARLDEITHRSNRRRRFRRLGALTAAMGLAIGAGWVGVASMTRRQLDAPPGSGEARSDAPARDHEEEAARRPNAHPIATPDPLPPVPSPAPSTKADLSEPPEVAPPRPIPANVAGKKGATGTPITVVVRVRPYAQRALLDGVEVARNEQRVAFRLTPGIAHRIQLEHACCFPFVKDLRPGESLPEDIKAALVPRPARLRVDGDPSTRIFINGKSMGRAGDSQRTPLEIRLPGTGDGQYEATVDLRLERDGHPPLLKGLRLRAGSELTFAAPELSVRGPGATDPSEALPP